MALAFIVMMGAVNDNDKDLSAIMKQVKAAENNSKSANLSVVQLRLSGPPFTPPKSPREVCQSNSDCAQGHTCVQGLCY